MVQPHFNSVFVSFEVVMEYFQGVNDGKEFFVVDLKVLFHRLMGLGMICNWVPTIKGIWLFKNCTCCKITGISDQPEGSGVVWKCEDRGSNKGLD